MTARVGRTSVPAAVGANRRRIQILEAVPSVASYEIKVYGDDQTLSTGDGQFIWMIPRELDGRIVTEVAIFVTTVSSSGDIEVQIENLTQSSVLLAIPATIDAGELDSYTATIQPGVNAAANIVSLGDQLSIDVDGAGTGAKGLGVIVTMA